MWNLAFILPLVHLASFTLNSKGRLLAHRYPSLQRHRSWWRNDHSQEEEAVFWFRWPIWWGNFGKLKAFWAGKKVLLYFVLFNFICRLWRVKDAFTPIIWQCHPTEWIGWSHLHSLILLSLRTHTGARHQWHLYPFEPLKEVLLKFCILFLMCNGYWEQINVSKWNPGEGWAAFRDS